MDILFFDRAAHGLLFVIALVWTRRIFWMRHFRRSNPPLKPVSRLKHVFPKVSVIVPARNEEKNILNCLSKLSKQSYPDYEIVVVDDRSSDRTPEILSAFQNSSAVPVRTVRVDKLPPGWTGKNHAMFTGSRAARGSWLLFTDADTTHSPESLETAMDAALTRQIDMLTLAPETESHSFWEKTVQPLAVSSLALWFQTQTVNRPDSKITLANGQFILIKKDVYDAVGGNEAVKDQVVEDVELAKRVKKAGHSLRFLNGTLLYSTRMYSSLAEILNGWTRIFTYLFDKSVPAILHKVFLFLFFSLSSFLLLFTEIAWAAAGSPFYSPALLASALIVSVFIVGVRAAGNKMLKTGAGFAVLHFVGSCVMVWILLTCVGRILFKRGAVWRGDQLPP